MTDANYNVIMTIDDAAHPAERIFYKAYGEPECFPFGDVDGDYDVDSNDGTLLVSMKNGNHPYNIFGDLNLDGQITQADVNLISNYAGMLGGTNILSTAEEQNDIGYAAYIWNDESQNYHVRNREYSPKLGRWLQKDPLDYGAGFMNLYMYVGSKPIGYFDPFGLAACSNGSCSTQFTIGAVADFDWGKGPRSRGNCLRYATCSPVHPWGHEWPEELSPELEEFFFRHQAYPGGKKAMPKDCAELTCEKLMQDLRNVGGLSPDTDCDGSGARCKSGEILIAVMIKPSKKKSCDYHFWRKGSDGDWEHKPGLRSEENLPGGNPENLGDRGDYSQFCGYICWPKNKRLDDDGIPQYINPPGPPIEYPDTGPLQNPDSVMPMQPLDYPHDVKPYPGKRYK